MEKTVRNRILVLGCSGSGKSTFSRKLQVLTGLPLIHLDNVWWKPDRTHITREEFDRQLEALLNAEAWIIDGDYSRTYERRIQAADTVIFLDFSEETCLDGIRQRIGQQRPDIPWTEQTLDPELEALVRGYRSNERPRLLALQEQYSEKEWIVLKTREEAENWLREEFDHAAP